MKSKLKKLVSILTVCVLLALAPATAFAQHANTQKEEVVYASLTSDGRFNKAFVINSFDMPQAGQIIDYGNYDSVTNLTTTDQLNRQNEEIKVNAPVGRFFYQGDLSRAVLPWDVSISYLLNGKAIDAKDLAGASGHLQINLSIKNRPDANQTFTKSFMLQTSLTFNTGVCSNITADTATIANSGKNKVITFIKMPDSNGDYTVQLDAEKFEMQGIQIAGLPLSLGIGTPDTGDLTEGIVQLQDGITSLNTGASGLNDGAQQLSGGSKSVTAGLQQFQGGLGSIQSGLASLVAGNPGLQGGSQQILDGLSSIQTNLSGLSIDTSDLTQLTQGSTAILQSISQMSGGLAGLESSFTLADQGIGLPGGLHQANTDTIAQLNAQIAALTAADPVANAAQIAQLTQIVGLLGANDGLISGLKTGINGDGTESNPGIAAGMAQLNTQYATFDAGIQALPAQLGSMASGMAQLKDGIDQLASNYTSFHGGLVQYTNGVQSLYQGYSQLCDGFTRIVEGSAQLTAGVDSLSNGTKEYANGVDELNGKTKNMDSEIQKQIEDMMKTYTGGDYSPVSFVSDKNTNIKSVQFVIITEEIKIAAAVEAKEQTTDPTFWDQLLQLFGIKK